MEPQSGEKKPGPIAAAHCVVGARLCWVANEELRQCLSDHLKGQLMVDCASCDLYLRFARAGDTCTGGRDDPPALRNEPRPRGH